jgi:uncharacterized protein (TIGR00251 family)
MAITPVSPPWILAARGGVILRIFAKPGASRRGILRADPRGLVIALNSQPAKGRANDELIVFVAATLGLPRTALELTSGAGSRHKSLRISTADPATVISQLIALAAASDA